MAVAHDAQTESHTGVVGSVSQASFSFTHTPSGTPRGVLVFTFCALTTTDQATAVTYGGVSMTAVAGGRAVDTGGEAGDCKAWFLGSSIPTGAQSVVVTRTNNAIEMWACSQSQTATTDTEVTGVVLLQENQAPAEQNVDDGTPGTNSMRYAGMWYGGAAPPTAGANSSNSGAIDLGPNTMKVVRETTPGQGSRPVGFSDAADDVAAVHLAVIEAAGGLSKTQILDTVVLNPIVFPIPDVWFGSTQIVAPLSIPFVLSQTTTGITADITRLRPSVATSFALPQVVASAGTSVTVEPDPIVITGSVPQVPWAGPIDATRIVGPVEVDMVTSGSTAGLLEGANLMLLGHN